MRTLQDLQQKQALPLSLKIRLTKARIREWINEFDESGVYVSFSGGKDSTVLLHIVREMYPNVPAVFIDTGLEYPEIREFVKTFDNVVWLKPKTNFRKVIETYGYPFISKEVSECVYGSRKYLTEVKNKQSLGERTNERTNENELLLAESHFKNQDHIYAYETDRILGTVEYYKALRANDPNATEKLPAKFKILLGVYPHRENGIQTGEYSNMFDKSRYAFFLDAPFSISHMCCNVMKKKPIKQYAKETGRVPITGQMASESRLRTAKWLKYGCNAFDCKQKISNPMSFWTEQDVLLYIYQNKIPIASVYGEVVKENEVDGQIDFADYGVLDLERPLLKTTGCNRTGCMFCGFGCHLEKSPNRFERMKETHPKQYEWIMKPWNEGGLGYKDVIDWMNEHGKLNIRY